MKSLLVIDDEPGHRLMVRAVMEDAGWQVYEAASGEGGLEFVSKGPGTANVVLLDMKMPGMDGQETLSRLHDLQPGLPVILLTAFGTVGSAVEAMKRGAFDYLAKPADNDELILTLNRAYEYGKLQEENDRLRTELASDNALRPIIGTSAAVRFVRDFIKQAGPSEATVLITGESGTGKELVADALHACSSRSGRQLIKVNCAALPAQLLESELFGYEKGAFTGAVKDKPGRFQLASGGTLFLDEIGEIPLDLQAKLLRAIQDRTVEPLGSVRTVAVDVRILAATNRNLRQRVEEGSFREDLFFRLNVLEVESPPLRERMDDLPLLVNHLLAVLSAKNRKEIRGVSPAFLQHLSDYAWPGNIRELENVLERALILSRSDVLDADALPPQIVQARRPQPLQRDETARFGYAAPEGVPGGPAGPVPGAAAAPAADHGMRGVPDIADHPADPLLPADPLSPADLPDAANSMLEEAERRALIEALRLHQGHRERTADALGISRRTLQYKLKKFGLIRRS